jgi:hypothetical protein
MMVSRIAGRVMEVGAYLGGSPEANTSEGPAVGQGGR